VHCIPSGTLLGNVWRWPVLCDGWADFDHSFTLLLVLPVPRQHAAGRPGKNAPAAHFHFSVPAVNFQSLGKPCLNFDLCMHEIYSMCMIDIHAIHAVHTHICSTKTPHARHMYTGHRSVATRWESTSPSTSTTTHHTTHHHCQPG